MRVLARVQGLLGFRDRDGVWGFRHCNNPFQQLAFQGTSNTLP